MVFPAVYTRIKGNLGAKWFDNQEYQELLELYEEEPDKYNINMISFRQKAEEKGLGSILARIMMLGDSLKSAPDRETEEFIYRIRSRGRLHQWNELHSRLARTKEQANFQALLGFILYLDTFLHHTQEGGI